MEYSPVALGRAEFYDTQMILTELERQFRALGITEERFAGKRVILKPNLLLGYSPEKCTTTHPTVVSAAALLAKNWGAGEVILAESPGGPYHLELLRSIYRSCGMEDGARRGEYRLNEDVTAVDLHYPQGEVSKMFHILTPVSEADLIINLCKLKTHSLAQMTCAVKNLFGVIPGIEKFEMHARFPETEDFFSMLRDLYGAVKTVCPVISVVDAVFGMEGEGPSGGIPRKFAMLGCSEDAFALDLACARVMGLEDSVPLLRLAQKYGDCPKSASELTYPLSRPEEFAVSDLLLPQTNMKSKFDLIPGFMRPRPVIDRSICVGCGKCVKSCPKNTIALENGKAKINRKNCIRCFCCQELCTFKAVKIHKSAIVRMLQSTKTVR